MSKRTWGPDYQKARDEKRLALQMSRVRNHMLAAAVRDHWLTVEEISEALEREHHIPFPEPSVSAQLRHLRKREFGGYDVRKRWRKEGKVSEYKLCAACKLSPMLTLFPMEPVAQ